MKTVLAYLKPHLGQVAFGITAKFIGTLADLLLPWLLAYTIDSVIPLENKNAIYFMGLIMGVSVIFALACNIVANHSASRVSRDCIQAMRHDLFVRISHLSNSQIDNLSVSSLETRLTTDTYNLHRMIGMMQRLGIRAPIMILGGIIVTLSLDYVLALTLIAIMPFIFGVAFYVSRKGVPMYNTLQYKIDHLTRIVRENVTGIRVIKALSKTSYEKERFAESNHEVADYETRAGSIMAISNPLMNLFLNIGLTTVIIVGAYRVNSGMMQAGKILAFLTYFTIILHALLAVNRMFIMYSKASASADRVAEVLHIPQDLLIADYPKKKSKYHIEFDHVSFSYLKEKENLSNLTFALKRGESLGILGATGSGKSTIIRLLMRLYDVDEGSIYINGTDVRSMPTDQLHTKFGVVFQNDVLFADTIEGNIKFGREISDKRMQQASEDAQAYEFIKNLDKKFQHKLTMRATNISGGQKQRVLLSRALAKKPEILILDDSSSALDYKTDANLRNALKTNYKDTTTIIIAQRISSVMSADHILLMDEGNVLAYGTHEELLASSTLYQQISENQLGGITHVRK